MEHLPKSKHYLHWEVVSRATSRSVSYTKRDMIASLTRAGCVVTQSTTASFILEVRYYLPEGYNEVCTSRCRRHVTEAIKVVHPVHTDDSTE
jgi:hypothetical protein